MALKITQPTLIPAAMNFKGAITEFTVNAVFRNHNADAFEAQAKKDFENPIDWIVAMLQFLVQEWDATDDLGYDDVRSFVVEFPSAARAIIDSYHQLREVERIKN